MARAQLASVGARVVGGLQADDPWSGCRDGELESSGLARCWDWGGDKRQGPQAG